MMIDFLLSFIFWIIAIIPCWAGYRYFTQQVLELPTTYIVNHIVRNDKKIAEKIIKHDNDLLKNLKNAFNICKNNPNFSKKILLKYRENLMERYQQYKYMKKDNENKIPRKYMELRMDEFHNFLYTMPPC